MNNPFIFNDRGYIVNLEFSPAHFSRNTPSLISTEHQRNRLHVSTSSKVSIPSEYKIMFIF